MKKVCEEEGVVAVCVQAHKEGGKGALELADNVVKLCNKPISFNFLYEDKISLKEKIEKVAILVYGALKVEYDEMAEKKLIEIEKLGFSSLPVCVAKTQYSFSTDPKKLGCPKNFVVVVKDVKLCSGAGFVVVLTNNIMTMPGFSKNLAAKQIDIVDGQIRGLF